MTEKEKIVQSIAADKKGWDILLDDLYFPPDLKHFKNCSTELIENSDGTISCLFYLVKECRMLCYTGLAAVFINKKSPELIFNSGHGFDYQFSQSLFFCEKYVVLRKKEMHFEETDLTVAPFVLIDTVSHKFTIIDFDFTSIYYTVDFLGGNKLIIRLNDPDNLKSLRVSVKNKNGTIIDLSKSVFLSFDRFDNALEQYCENKKTASPRNWLTTMLSHWQKFFGSNKSTA
jgi:hypothetical protein